ncbi:MAG: homoserine dehydrogenase [Euryarchaeota archaeon RBG_19FT_COMBO_56_21]|nr:MAG: homoserine dehydrogenase [Euryarchaeota archaeon RBG_19FT_COMBO_56_21]
MRVILVGFGVVGRSFAELVETEARKLDRDFGLRPRIVAVVDHLGAAVAENGLDVRKVLESKKKSGIMEGLGEQYSAGRNALEVIKDVECEVVVESTPTELQRGEPGLSHVRAALKEGRHVICTNKGPLAIAMPALMELANHNNVLLKFSGTVGGGTPVLDFAKKCLEGSKIRSISGILNGTSNFILSKMASEGVTMQSALAEAQKLGYAEADPTYDVGGFDTACKLVITSNYVLGTSLSIKDVRIRGITEVSNKDVEQAKSKGSVIKLIGKVEKNARVQPQEIPSTHPLNVSGTFNAVSFDTVPAGEITLVGKGAGGMETASSVLRDLIEIRRAFAR